VKKNKEQIKKAQEEAANKRLHALSAQMRKNALAKKQTS